MKHMNQIQTKKTYGTNLQTSTAEANLCLFSDIKHNTFFQTVIGTFNFTSSQLMLALQANCELKF